MNVTENESLESEASCGTVDARQQQLVSGVPDTQVQWEFDVVKLCGFAIRYGPSAGATNSVGVAHA